MLNLGEIFKLAKEHNILPELLAKEEIAGLVRLINLKQRRKREELSSVDQEGFTQLFLQMAHTIYYGKQKRQTLAVIEMLELLVQHMAKAMLYKGESVQLYEEPDFVVGVDRQRLKELNRRIREEPNMSVPDGFYKVYEKDLCMEYTVPEYVPMRESQRVAVEVLDGVLWDVFGMHWLEARAKGVVVPRVK